MVAGDVAFYVAYCRQRRRLLSLIVASVFISDDAGDVAGKV